MADTKISDLTAVTDIQTTDEYVLARSGANKKITGADLVAEIGGGAGAVTLLNEIIVPSGGQPAIDYTSIAGSYRHLFIEYVAKSEGGSAADLWLRFNNDSGSNYNLEVVRGTGGSASASTLSSQTQGYVGTIGQTAATFWSHGRIDIPYYSVTTTTKAAMCTYVAFNGSSQNETGVFSSMWTGTAAITRVTLTLSSSADWKEGSVFGLYGIG